MAFTFLTGGARSGKSRLAVELVAELGGEAVFIATATAGDEEMRTRIARHREERPASWATLEEPTDLAGAVGRSGPSAPLVIDCLTLWVANLLGAGRRGEEIEKLALEVTELLSARPGVAVVVSNEVGAGIVPFDAPTRSYRDVLGAVNTVFSLAADQAALVVSGRLLPLELTSALSLRPMSR